MTIVVCRPDGHVGAVVAAAGKHAAEEEEEEEEEEEGDDGVAQALEAAIREVAFLEPPLISRASSDGGVL